MKSKVREKQEAIRLRNLGMSYSEIIKTTSVSKSTLSLWLRDLKINDDAKLILEKKHASAQKLGAKAKRTQRVKKVKKIEAEAISQIPKINRSNLFLMGIMLYWAEGSKQRGSDQSQRVEFSNSDSRMCKLFLKWLTEAVEVPREDVMVCIYIHESKKTIEGKIISYWSNQIGVPKELMGKVYYTKTVYPRKKQRKESKDYFGQLRIRVRKSTDLNRRIVGWIKGICIQSGVEAKNLV